MSKETLYRKTVDQFKKCAVPTVVAVAAGAVIAKLGIPVIVIGAAAGGVYAYLRGYRLQVVRIQTVQAVPEAPAETPKETPSETDHPAP